MTIYSDIFNQNAITDTDFNLDTHIKWLYHHIYQKPYQEHLVTDDSGIARLVHGIQHVTRAACYVPILINLYRLQGDNAALQLNTEDVYLLTLAVLIHDSGREGEAEDLWDQDSAVNLYYYLTKIIQVDKQKAIRLAEAIANKDAGQDAYYALYIDSDEKPTWQKVEARAKNIYQRIVHDADCLDVIRARKIFDGRYLDILAKDLSNLDIISQLIIAVRKLIYQQGDKWLDNNIEIKKKYNNEDCLYRMVQDIKADYFLNKLYNNHQLLAQDKLIELTEYVRLQKYDANVGITAENLTHALLEGKLLFHGIELPIGLTNNINHAEKEITQVYKTDGKIDSANLIGYGSPLSCNAGFIAFLDSCNLVSDNALEKDLAFFDRKKSGEEKIKHMLNTQKLGGSGKKVEYLFGSYLAKHTHLTYKFNNYHAVLFSNHENYNNAIKLQQKNGLAFHPHAPFLEAVFLQQQFRTIMHKEIAIFEYLPIENRISEVIYNGEKITTMMIELCMCYIEKEADFIRANNLTPDEIKVYALYGNNINIPMISPDFYYKSEWQEKINYEVNNKLNCVISRRLE